MPHSKGFRHKTRKLLSTKRQRRGLAPFLRSYRLHEKVAIDIDPSQVKGMPHRRYQGRIGSVEEIRQRSLVVAVPVGGKVKKVITRLEHVRPHLEVARHA